MNQFITDYISAYYGQFYISQLLSILILIVYGLLFMTSIRGRKISALDLLISYPVALIIYSITGYFLLSVGIVFNAYSVITTMLIVLAAVFLIFRNTRKQINVSHKIDLKKIVIYLAIAVVFGAICVSGIIPVSVTNDSMYFFSEYPRALVRYGELNSFLDNFLTDASQGIAIIGTMPFLFGFDEVFGIQTLLNVNFIAFFVYSVYEYSVLHIQKKASYAISVIAFILLISSMPFVLMSRWFMANMFFMEYLAIVVYVAYRFKDSEDTTDLLILSVLITGLSIMRMEGALNAGVLVLCIMMLGYKNKDIVLYMICPMMILQSLYLYKIFKRITLHTEIQFMTEQKAMILIAFLVCIILYALIIRGRISIIDKHYPLILTMGLVLVNVLVFFYDMPDYTTNIKAFIANVLRNSGWGLFASMVVGIIILIPKKSMKINYFDYTVICYILLTVVAGWARGDNLYESFGDSGNRILIQVVPILLFALIIKIVEGIEYWKKERLS